MAGEPMPRWFRAVIGEGIQRLIAIGLPGGPGLDSMKLTAQAWGETLWEAPVQWERNADSSRIEQAFKRAGRSCDRWPTPKQVLELMPARRHPPALPGPKVSKAERERNRRRVRELMDAALGRRHD